MAQQQSFPYKVALTAAPERTYASGDATEPADFMHSLRWKQFTDLWIEERRRQLQVATESGR